MTEFPLNSEIQRQALEELLEDTLRKYRMDAEQARTLILEEMDRYPALLAFFQGNPSIRQVRKNRHFQELKSSARKKIYYRLRQYNEGDAQEKLLHELAQIPPGHDTEKCRELVLQLAQTHASTRERLPYRQEFYGTLQEFAGDASSILDIGAGIQPLLFPFAGFPYLKNYLALEKDPRACRILEVFKPYSEGKSFDFLPWNIRDSWEALRKKPGPETWDFAFMLKLIPVIRRVEPDLWDMLAATPARKWLISGSKTALAKQQDIQRREMRDIHAFLERTGKSVTGKFETPEEFCIIAE